MPFIGTTPTQGFVSSFPKQSFTPNGSTTVFTLTNPVATANDLEVFVGNVRQEPTTAYTAAGTTLTMSEAPASGLNFYVINKSFAQVTTNPPDGSVSSAKMASGAALANIGSGTITDASGRTLSGQTVEAFVISISHIPLLSIGFNCALGADQLLPYVKRLSNITNTYTSVHPNAGLPNAFGAYDQTATEMSELIENYLKENIINIVGGCCGTKPEHIRLIAEVARNYKPRKI